MKAVIPERLLSIYHLTVPYALDVQKIRQRLDGELEKLHPCFPERYTADYHINLKSCGQRGSGIHIRAVVIDRLQLADLRKENANRLLYADGNRPYPVFSGNILKRRLCVMCAALVAVIATLTAVCFSLKKADSVPAGATESSAFIASDTSSADDSLESGGFLTEVAETGTATADASALTDYSPFMSFIYKQGGSISALSWNAESGVLSLQVSALYPEQLSGAALPETGMMPASVSVRFGPVAYRAGVPEMQVMLTAPEKPEQFPLREAARNGTDPLISLPAVRALILEHGGTLVSESVSPPSLLGSVPEAAWASFVSALQTLLGAEGFDRGTEGASERRCVTAAVCQLELTRADSSISVAVSLADDDAPDCSQLPFSDLSCVFLDAPGFPYAPPAEDEWTAAVAGQREIGRITRDDGSFVVFFHDEDGKIERRVYE